MTTVAVTLVPTQCLFREPCYACSGRTAKEPVRAEITFDGEPSREVLCLECLDRGAEEIESALLEKALYHRQWAEHLETVATAQWEMPTLAEYEAAVSAEYMLAEAYYALRANDEEPFCANAEEPF